jgi:hypothetical protein
MSVFHEKYRADHWGGSSEALAACQRRETELVRWGWAYWREDSLEETEDGRLERVFEIGGYLQPEPHYVTPETEEKRG